MLSLCSSELFAKIKFCPTHDFAKIITCDEYTYKYITDRPRLRITENHLNVGPFRFKKNQLSTLYLHLCGTTPFSVCSRLKWRLLPIQRPAEGLPSPNKFKR